MAIGIGGLIAAAPVVLETIERLVDRFVPDPAQKAQAALDIQKVMNEREVALAQAMAEVNKAQIGVNAVEAQSANLFVAGWRPAVGWVGVVGLAGGLIFQPLLTWATAIASVAIGAALPPPPSIDVPQVIGLLSALLGFGAYRTYEKIQGVPDSPVQIRKPR